MFDNPSEELKKLEAQLLAIEEPDDDFEAFYSDVLREFGPENKKPQVHKSSSSRRNVPQKNTYSDQPRRPAPAKKQKGVKGLVITLCLECLGIVGIILWWILRFL